MAEKKRKGGRRKKGLEWLREIKQILIRNGCEVEGPGYGLRFFGNKKHGQLQKIGKPEEKTRPVIVHCDYFGCFDLISYRPDMGYVFHQGSIIEEKSRKIDDLITRNKPGWVWGRFKEENKTAYRIFVVNDGWVYEREEVIFVTPKKEKEDFGMQSNKKQEF